MDNLFGGGGYIIYIFNMFRTKLTEPGHQDMVAQTGTVPVKPGHLEAGRWIIYYLRLLVMMD